MRAAIINETWQGVTLPAVACDFQPSSAEGHGRTGWTVRSAGPLRGAEQAAPAVFAQMAADRLRRPFEAGGKIIDGGGTHLALRGGAVQAALVRRLEYLQEKEDSGSPASVTVEMHKLVPCGPLAGAGNVVEDRGIGRGPAEVPCAVFCPSSDCPGSHPPGASPQLLSATT